MSEKILEIKDERLSFFTPAGEVKALNGVSFSMNQGDVLGIVGESGSGKSVTAYSINESRLPGAAWQESRSRDNGYELVS